MNNINELNRLLEKYKPNLLLELSIWPETYSYTLTLMMLTQLPILSLKKNMSCVVENRLSKYDKYYIFENKILEKALKMPSNIAFITALEVQKCKYLLRLASYIYNKF